MHSKFYKRAAALLTAVIMLCTVAPVCAFAAEDNEAKLAIPIEKVMTGHTMTTAETFTFQLKAIDGAPLPAGTDGDVITTTITGAGEGTFPEITYTDASTYRYEVSEVKGKNPMVTYDSTVYTITVMTTYEDQQDGSQQLVATLYTYVDGQANKADSIVFRNRFTSPSTGESYSLAISKIVTGFGDQQAEFEFTVRLNGKLYTGQYFINGVSYQARNGVVRIRHGQTAYIYSLNQGTSYVVSEKNYTSLGYVTTSKNAIGRIDFGPQLVEFVNYAPDVPDTGNDTPYGLLWTIFGLCCAGLIVRVYRTKKENESDKKSS